MEHELASEEIIIPIKDHITSESVRKDGSSQMKQNNTKIDKARRKSLSKFTKVKILIIIQQYKPYSVKAANKKVVNEALGPEFALHEFKNLHSLLNAWHFANYKLNLSFDSQTKTAMVNKI